MFSIPANLKSYNSLNSSPTVESSAVVMSSSSSGQVMTGFCCCCRNCSPIKCNVIQYAVLLRNVKANGGVQNKFYSNLAERVAS